MVYAQETKKVLNDLVDNINNFDLYFEMSDSSFTYQKSFDQKVKLLIRLKNLTPDEKEYTYSKLNDNGKKCWKRYFKID